MRQLAEVGTAIAESAFSPQGKEAKQLLDEAETKHPGDRRIGRAHGRRGFARCPRCSAR